MATKRLQQPFEDALMGLFNKEVDQDPPICLISDSLIGWTNMSSSFFGLPRLVFHGMGVLPMAVKKSLSIHRHQTEITDDHQLVEVKGVRLQFPLRKGDLPRSLIEEDSNISQFFLEAERCDLESWGVIANSFLELESNYVATLNSLYGGSVVAWCAGPLFLYDQMEEGGDKTGPPSTSSWAQWLDKPRTRNSVLYISFGSSQAELSSNQLDELAHGLDLSGWTTFGEVLAHKAIGGFLSHCGWNSVLESLSNGVPILAWPLQAEQPLNAKYVVEELRVGLRVPNTTTTTATRGLVGERLVVREVVCDLVTELMQGGRGRTVRERALLVERMAKKTVQPGGSSYRRLNHLVEQFNQSHSLWTNYK
ncbi:hypothetical protein JRO89_XS03G0231900 [Xanthoceras sorbifolium]|uniref:UDP-glycosyltransferases domain-containing protein n=1 Tax=Xanthoceras sorbifolium TaxID=99658 RepID=A0ABQ8IBK1_9ROSI|nr:hypothetical protein JRO89_XS03G0231900 [Xanthoceras sorbifolium]